MNDIEKNTIINGNSLEVLKSLPDNSIDCCVTSPPYYALRDYGCDGQIGLEETPEKYIERLCDVFSEVRRILTPEGTLWLNIADSYWGGGWRNAQFNEHSGDIQKGSKGTYCGLSLPACKGKVGEYKPKDLIGIPWMLAFALRSQGWYLRQDIIWHKPNPMPESVTDRCTKSHEYIFLLSKSQRYYFDYEAIQEEATGYDGRKDTMMKGSKKYDTQIMPNQSVQSMAKNGHERWKFKSKNCQCDGQQPNSEAGITDDVYPVRNKRDVWQVNTKPCKEAHFATYPFELIKPCILAGCPENGIVLDPFMGSGTTAIVARSLNRNYLGVELNPEYIKIAHKRLEKHLGMFQ